MTTNFLGIPVEGDITEGVSRLDQQPIEELQPLLQAVLDDPTIVEFGWSQYTPYFNDGDVCEFGVGEIWVRTVDDVDTDETQYDDYDLTLWNHPSMGSVKYEYQGEGWERRYVELGYEGPDEARYERVKALDVATTSGHFDDVLLDAFGDHAHVTIRRDGISVEFYEHD